MAQGLAKPSRVDSRVTVGRGFGDDSRRHRDAGLSNALYCPPPGFFSGQRLARNKWDLEY